MIHSNCLVLQQSNLELSLLEGYRICDVDKDGFMWIYASIYECIYVCLG